MEEEKQKKLIEATDKALNEQILPLLFTKAQLEDMEKPYRSVYDYAVPAHIFSFQKELEHVGYLSPQLQVSDPRITDEMIERLPKTISVECDGQTYTLPLRVFKYCYTNTVQEYEEHLEKIYAFRQLSEKLEKSLTDKFNLSANKDFVINYALSAKGEALIIEAPTPAAQAVRDDIKKHVEDTLPKVGGDNIKEVWIMNPMVPL